MKQFIFLTLSTILLMFGCQKADEANPFEDNILADENEMHCTPLKVEAEPYFTNDPPVIIGLPVETDSPVDVEDNSLPTVTPPPTSTFGIEEVQIEKSCLVFDLFYSGGCKTHSFDLTWNGEFRRVTPQRADILEVNLELVHSNGGDLCEAFIKQTEAFDISDLGSIQGKAIHIYINDLEIPVIYNTLLIY